MVTDNDRLKSLLFEAKDACRVKMEQLSKTRPEDDADLNEIDKTINEVFEKFRIEGIWAQPIPFDEGKLLQHILAVHTMDDENLLPTFKAQVVSFKKYLEKEVLPKPLEALMDSLPSDWNMKMLEAIRLLRGSITRKKTDFTNQGNNPMDDDAFGIQDLHFAEAVELYRSKLKNNEVDTDQNDLKTMGYLNSMISSVSELVKFTQYYVLLNKFIDKKIVTHDKA